MAKQKAETNLKKSYIFAPQDGLNKDVSPLLLEDSESPDLDNVERDRNIVRRARGTSFLGDTLDNEALLIDEYHQWDGDVSLMTVSRDTVYKYHPTTETFDSQGSYAGSSGRFVSSDTFNNLWILTDFENNIKKHNGSTLSDLGGLTDIQARLVKSFYSHLLLGYTLESGVVNPSRIRWCNLNAPEDWTGGTSGFLDLVSTADHLVNWEGLLDKLYVYKENSIWEGIHVGYPNVFFFQPIITELGLVASKSLTTIHTFHMFMAVDGIYLFDGRQLKDITKGVYDLLYGPNALLNKAAISTCVGIYVKELGEYWLAVPLGSDTIPKHILRYHLKSGTWWKRSFTATSMGTSIFGIHSLSTWSKSSAEGGNTWAAAAGTWAAYTGIWRSATRGEFPVYLIGCETTLNTQGRVARLEMDSVSDPGTVPIAYIDSKDYVFNSRTRFTALWVEVLGSGTIEAQYAKDGEGNTWTSLGSKTVQSDWRWLKWHFNFTSEVTRFRLIPGSAEQKIRKRKLIHKERTQ